MDETTDNEQTTKHEKTAKLIPSLFFDRDGMGPDHLYLEVHAIQQLRIPDEPPILGIRVRAGELVLRQDAQVDGGHMFYREQVVELHKQLGEWLEANPDIARKP